MASSSPVPSPGAKWGLAALVDLEAQLFADRGRSEGELIARDAPIGRKLRETRPSRSALLAGWVAAMRGGKDAPLPGRFVGDVWVQAKWLLSVVLFVVGVGAAAAVLRFTGEHPINVLIVLGVFVIAQLAALLLTLLFFAVAAWAPGLFESLPLVVLARGAIVSLLRRVARRPEGANVEKLGWVRGRRSLYTQVERNLLFVLLQQSGVAFNLGVLATFLVAVTFSDLAFGWGTTLSIGAEQLHRLCAALTVPWASWLEEATVSMELVRATQYSRLEGDYVKAAEGASRALSMYGHWWRFLVMAIITYGLLPRLILLLLSNGMLRRTLDRLPPETPEVERLLMRLTVPLVHATHEQDPGDTSRLGEGFDAVGQPPDRFDHGTALCARWRDAIFEDATLVTFLEHRYGLGVEGEVGSAGGHDYEADRQLLARIESNDLPIFVFVEPWGAPDRAFQRFVADARARGGERRHITVVLTEGGSPDDAAIWRGYLSEMADPYLALDRTPMASRQRAS
jgi:hypothetical protein